MGFMIWKLVNCYKRFQVAGRWQSKCQTCNSATLHSIYLTYVHTSQNPCRRAGAIGCLVGGKLALAGNDVTLAGRCIAEAIRSHGLRLIDRAANS